VPPDVDPRLVRALEEQLEAMRATLQAGARRVGWKVGAGEEERIGDGPVVGHLTSATVLEPGSSYPADSDAELHADAEVFLELGHDGIARSGVALELCDLGPPEGAEAIVATNVFHRAVIFGPAEASLPDGDLEGRLIVNGQVRAAAPARRDHAETLQAIARLLEAVGERLRPGDRVITGSIVQVPVAPGDQVWAELQPATTRNSSSEGSLAPSRNAPAATISSR